MPKARTILILSSMDFRGFQRTLILALVFNVFINVWYFAFEKDHALQVKNDKRAELLICLEPQLKKSHQLNLAETLKKSLYTPVNKKIKSFLEIGFPTSKISLQNLKVLNNQVTNKSLYLITSHPLRGPPIL